MPRSASFFWQGGLLLLPTLILGILGFFFLRQESLRVEEAARREASQWAEAQVLRLHDRFWQRASDLNLVSTGLISRTGGLISPPAETRPDVTAPPLTITEQEKLDAATALELAGKFDEARKAYQEFIVLSPAPAARAEALYAMALLNARRGQQAGMVADLDRLKREFGTVPARAGIAFGDLADWKRIETDTTAAPDRVRILASNLVAHPTLISRPLLDKLSAMLPSERDFLSAQIRRLDADQKARKFLSSASPAIQGESGSAWVASDGELHWVSWKSDSIHEPVRVQWMREASIKKLVEELRVYAPPYLTFSFTFGRHPLDKPIAASPLVSRSSDVPSSLSGPLDFSVLGYLTDPGLMRKSHRSRLAWISALIVVSMGSALLGWWAARRAFLRQLQLNEMKSNFVSSVSHELRAPIASMRLMAEGLERGAVSEPARQREYFKMMVQECRRLSALILNVLDFSRIDLGRKKYEFEPTDLPQLVGATVTQLRPYATDKGIALELEHDTERWNGTGAILDGRAIQQALVNLIDNAIKHSPAGSAVRVGLAKTADRISLWVEDKGGGIPAAEHEKIFERFYRRGTELRRETEGVGIGLSLVKHIVEAHGGQIHVRSAPGEGSRFEIDLPTNGGEGPCHVS